MGIYPVYTLESQKLRPHSFLFPIGFPRPKNKIQPHQKERNTQQLPGAERTAERRFKPTLAGLKELQRKADDAEDQYQKQPEHAAQLFLGRSLPVSPVQQEKGEQVTDRLVQLHRVAGLVG